MIKIEELRPGNAVDFYNAEKDYWFYVRLEDEDHIDSIGKCPHLFKPIPLNKNILEGLSFEEMGFGYYARGNVSIKLVRGLYYILDENPYTPINFMHQLQNIYADRNEGEMIDLPT